MVDIPLQLSPDGTSIDWPNPAVLAQPGSRDLEPYVVMLLANRSGCTDRAIRLGAVPTARIVA
jgi:hypothetical protein